MEIKERSIVFDVMYLYIPQLWVLSHMMWEKQCQAQLWKKGFYVLSIFKAVKLPFCFVAGAFYSTFFFLNVATFRCTPPRMCAHVCAIIRYLLGTTKILGQLCSSRKCRRRQDDFRMLGKLIIAFIPEDDRRNKYASLCECGPDWTDFQLRCLLHRVSCDSGLCPTY